MCVDLFSIKWLFILPDWRFGTPYLVPPATASQSLDLVFKQLASSTNYGNGTQLQADFTYFLQKETNRYTRLPHSSILQPQINNKPIFLNFHASSFSSWCHTGTGPPRSQYTPPWTFKTKKSYYTIRASQSIGDRGSPWSVSSYKVNRAANHPKAKMSSNCPPL